MMLPPYNQPASPRSRTLTFLRDFAAGLVVFLVALPLCLGVAHASDAPLLSGVLAGIVGGVLVGLLSGSHTSVSGPAAGITAVVAAQIVSLGSFPAFLLAVIFAGLIQVGLGLARAGSIASFFPASVIKGLLASIGLILILKQIPHVLGHDLDPEGDLAFLQHDHENTFSELVRIIGDIHPGAAVIGLTSLAALIVFDRWKWLKRTRVPVPLLVVLMGVVASLLFRRLGGDWEIGSSHLVDVPEAKSLSEFVVFLSLPDFSQWRNPAIYTSAMMIAAVASLETLLNLEAVDKIDPERRTSPPNRELIAQGIGNMVVGLIGGLPITSVVIRSSANLDAGGKTRLAAVIHGLLLLMSVVFLPLWLNQIPLSCLAAILLVTGVKLISPALIKQMWNDGRYQFIPFAATVIAIVFTDLLIGVLIGLVVSIAFILNSNMRRPIRRFVEKHLGGDVLHIELANQVSFLNRAALSKVLDQVGRGGQVLLDARNTDYIDPDVLDLVRDFKERSGPARGVEVSLVGFRSKYHILDQIQFVDYSTRDIQVALTPPQVLQILKDGHERFRTGQHLTRDFGRQVSATADEQHPLAVILSCIDSRAPAELIFDLGMGDILNVRVAGNVTSRKVLASVEYGCAVAGAKLILVMGHTRCGAVTAAVNLIGETRTAAEATGCQHLDYIIHDIQQSTHPVTRQRLKELSAEEMESYIDDVARRNVLRVVQRILQQSQTLGLLAREGRIGIVGAVYDVASGDIEFLENE